MTLSTPRPCSIFSPGSTGWSAETSAKLTADRVAYFCHPDWMVDPGRGAPEALWKPRIETEQGLAETARWYREAGWL